MSYFWVEKKWGELGGVNRCVFITSRVHALYGSYLAGARGKYNALIGRRVSSFLYLRSLIGRDC